MSGAGSPASGDQQQRGPRGTPRQTAPAPTTNNDIMFGPYRLSLAEKALFKGDEGIRLGSRAMDILIALAERQGETVAHAALMRRVWPDTYVTENTLRVHITALRKALGGGEAGRRYILSSSGRGYMLVAAAGPGRKPAIARVSARLPQPAGHLFGRAELVEAVLQEIAQHRLVTLVGPGGVGKTSVALAAAHRAAPDFADGCVFLDLSPITHGQRVAVSLATALGIEQTYAGDLVQTICQQIGAKHQLIILDTCEHVVESTAKLVAKLLTAAPNLRILATSREKLRIHEEWVRVVPGLSLPDPSQPLSLATAASAAAIELFVYRTRAAGATFALDENNLTAVVEICRKLDGLPLAIELAAARLDELGIETLLYQLQDRFHVLTDGYRDALPRHQTLHATIAWSHDLLSAAEQALFRRLGVFRQAMSADAAAAVAGGDVVASAEVPAMMQNLAAKSLLMRSGDAAGALFRLLDSSAAFAQASLRVHHEAAAVGRRHAEFFRNLLEETWPNEIPPDADRALLRSLSEEVQAAAAWAEHAGDKRLFAELVTAAVPLWLHLSLAEHCRAQSELALARLPDTSELRPLRMKLNAAIGGAHLSVDGAGAKVRAAWGAVLEIAEALGDAEYQLRALWGLWADLRNRGLYLEAFRMAQRFEVTCRKTRHAAYRGTAERLLGVSRFVMGEFKEARGNLDRALAILSSGASPSIVALQFDQVMLTRCNIAFLHWIEGRQALALTQVEEIVAQAIQSGHGVSLCYALSDCACPLSYLGREYELAERYTALLMQHSEARHTKIWNMVGRCFEGMIAVRRGHVMRGIARLEETLDGLGQIGAGPIHAQYAHALMMAGRAGEAMAVIEREIAQCVSGERWFLAEYHRLKGEIAAYMGDGREAEASFMAAIELARTQQAYSWELRAATSLAEHLTNAGKLGTARRILKPALARYAPREQSPDLVRARAILG